MKTVSLDEDAYALLRGAKTDDSETFSSLIRRLLMPTVEDDLEAAFGSWAEMTADEAARLRDETRGGLGLAGGDPRAVSGHERRR